MSGRAYGANSGQGGMSPKGETTPVRLRPATPDPVDKKVICKAVCVCSREPDTGASGQSLKQQCVSRNLRDVDRSMGWKSPYKSEVNYDMTQIPPSPIMRSASPLEPHPYLPGWIQKYWPGGKDAYPARAGAVRRPDVVIVRTDLCRQLRTTSRAWWRLNSRLKKGIASKRTTTHALPVRPKRLRLWAPATVTAPTMTPMKVRSERFLRRSPNSGVPCVNYLTAVLLPRLAWVVCRCRRPHSRSIIEPS